MEAALRRVPPMLLIAATRASVSSPNILVNGQNVTFTFQYPTNATVRTALDNVEGFATGGVLNRFTKSGARTPANCWVEYQAPTVTNTRPVIAYPAGVIGVAGVTELAVDTALRAAC